MAVVSCQLSVVDVVFGRRGSHAANRFEVVVQLGAEFIEKRLELRNGSLREKSSPAGAAQPVFGIIQRTPRVAHESAVVCVRPTPCSFSDVGSDAAGRSDDLCANSVFSEMLPAKRCIPDCICAFFREIVNAKILKVCSHKLFAAHLAKSVAIANN
jgi:hypothetical protein